jgi:hypothetical protein
MQLIRDPRDLSQLSLRAQRKERNAAEELGLRIFPEKHDGILVVPATVMQPRVVVVTQW